MLSVSVVIVTASSGVGVGDHEVEGEGAPRLGPGEGRGVLDDLDLGRVAGDGDHGVVVVGDHDACRVGGGDGDDVGLAVAGVAGERRRERAGVGVARTGAGLEDRADGGGAGGVGPGGEVAVDVVGERRDREDLGAGVGDDDVEGEVTARLGPAQRGGRLVDVDRRHGRDHRRLVRRPTGAGDASCSWRRRCRRRPSCRSPTAVGVKSAEVAVGGGPPASGRAELVKIGAPVQVGLAGPKRVKVTVPVGVGAGGRAPVTVAVSRIGWVRVTGLKAWVTMVAVGRRDHRRLVGRAARAGGRRVVGVTAVDGDPVVGADGGGREVARVGRGRRAAGERARPRW